MRIITGQYKGKLIKMPKGIRPTQNKVRKAIFDILGDITGLSFLEFFAGSGAVGLEAGSCGAGELAFVESGRHCYKLIEENIALLGIEKYSLYPLEAQKAIELFNRNRKKFDIIFLDPPYDEGAKKTLQAIGLYDILAPNGLIVAQHAKKEHLPDTLGDLVLFKQKSYGDTVLSLYQWQKKLFIPAPLTR